MSGLTLNLKGKAPMSKKTIFCSIALTCLMSIGLHAVDKKPETPPDCGTSPRPMRVTARHMEAKGIGYNQGYSTLEGFFAPAEPWNDAWVPFLDLRGHVFNNGRWAANGGLGMRYIATSRVWGANVYYDYRKTNRQHYNQVSFGLESLGKIWDFRVNGYIPVGTTASSHYHRRFDKFKGNYMYVSRKREFALKGANAEIGAHVDSIENAPFYFAAGPYFLTGYDHTAWGGEFRAAVDLFKYVRLEGSTSYDNIFKWIGQGQISLNFSFGGKRRVKTKNGNSCSTALALSKRAVQRVDRHEIIPVDTHRHSSKGINPATGEPWFFVFVDNTSSSLGTFESPFPTLLQAQNASSPNDVIYVFPGDGTTTGMASGITLQDEQMLLGASMSHLIPTTVGDVTIPSMASEMPSITNTPDDVVTLANDNTVSGFVITTNTLNQNGIVGTSISNLDVDRNIFATTATDTNGIFLSNPTGTVNVSDCTFDGFSDVTSAANGNGIYALLDNGDTLDTLSVSGSSFTNINNPAIGYGGNGIFVDFESGSGTLTNLNISESTFSNFSDATAGVFAHLNASGSTLTNLNVAGSTFSNFADSSNLSFGVVARLFAPGASITNFNVTRSSFSDMNDGCFGALASVAADGILTNYSVSDSIFSRFSGSSNNHGGAVAEADSGGTIVNASVTGCIFSDISGPTSFGSVFVLFGAGASIENGSISGCTYNNMSDFSSGALVFGIGGTLNNCSVSDCAFNNMSSGSTGVATAIFVPSTITDLSVLDNNFSNIGDTSVGVYLSTSVGTIPTMDVNGNTFTDNLATNNGYGAVIDVSNGTACLKFTNNTATPASTPDPYLFTQSGVGTFNRTTGSDSSTNTGTIDIVGTVGAPGSCTQ